MGVGEGMGRSCGGGIGMRGRGFNKSIHDTGRVHPLAQFSAPHQSTEEIVGDLANEAIKFGKAVVAGPEAVIGYAAQKVIDSVGDVYRRDKMVNQYKEKITREKRILRKK